MDDEWFIFFITVFISYLLNIDEQIECICGANVIWQTINVSSSLLSSVAAAAVAVCATVYSAAFIVLKLCERAHRIFSFVFLLCQPKNIDPIMHSFVMSAIANAIEETKF